MNEPRKKNPTLGVGVLIVVVVLFVIGTVLFNALRSKREYDETVGAQASHAATSATASQAGSATQ
ncbi:MULTISPECIES: hypothetical protein [Paraburkholderia]|jgi:hypothetical protein|uniref:Uncharacterized protein n=1 Tax=Paraburkholderia tropica TaxID=92647 RepID=A0A1A5XAA0_9BURK|nr:MULTISPECIES: hypothetical protein [Paraburkholderia]MBB2982321.1 hypothetical protein [Paraburkholderia tropica]MBN3814906.1 hypothetical protein [Paraburkholderia sp. Ac-20347]OBR50377.1 hypothetical protein A6456_19010 [Paraburkholderia tropica]RQM49226.1 hypothetical protein EHZ19_06125 [Paraburkholderia bannensis]RQN34616.1 hypothetical protein EHZ25_33730 [Paraburkholderia tropica]